MNLQLLLAAPGLAVVAWYVARRRADHDPLGPWPNGALPDTTVPFVGGMAAWLFAQGFLVGLLADTEAGRHGGTAMSSFAVAFANALIAAALLPFALRGERKPNLPEGRILAAGVLGALVVVTAQVALGLAIEQAGVYMDFKVPSQAIVEDAKRSSGTEVVTFGVSALVLAPFAEEIFFRGTMLPALSRVMGGRSAILLQAICFGAIHVGAWNTWPLAIPLAVVGWAAGFLYVRTGSLAAPIAMHAAFNAINFALLRTV